MYHGGMPDAVSCHIVGPHDETVHRGTAVFFVAIPRHRGKPRPRRIWSVLAYSTVCVSEIVLPLRKLLATEMIYVPDIGYLYS